MGTAISVIGVAQYSDATGVPYAGGKLYTYEAGTTTPKATYSDFAGAVPNTNPVILDSAGRATIRLAAGAYKYVLKDADDVTVFTQDDILSITGLVSGTAGVLPKFRDDGSGLGDSVVVQDDGRIGVGGGADGTAMLKVTGGAIVTESVMAYSSEGCFVAGTQTLTNKSDFQASNTGTLALKHTTTPTHNPSYCKLYVKADNTLYLQTADGTEKKIGWGFSGNCGVVAMFDSSTGETLEATSISSGANVAVFPTGNILLHPGGNTAQGVEISHCTGVTLLEAHCAAHSLKAKGAGVTLEAGSDQTVVLESTGITINASSFVLNALPASGAGHTKYVKYDPTTKGLAYCDA